MKIYCEKCNGIGVWFVRIPGPKGVNEIECKCEHCNAKGFIDEFDSEAVTMSFKHYEKIKVAANNWNMIEWAINKSIKFIAVPYDKEKPWAVHINQDDIDMLIELYEEHKKE